MSERKMREDGLGRGPTDPGCRPSDETPAGSHASGASIPRASVEALEEMLRSLLQGEHTSLTISFNDCNAPNYMTVRDYLAGEGPGSDTDWVSDEERVRAIETNSWWTAHWYPHTPVGFHSFSAASLPTLVATLADEAPAIETEGEDAKRLSAKHESAIGKAEAPINSTMLSALKAMDEALTEWIPRGPEDARLKLYLPDAACEAWSQIRSAISQADGQG